MQEEIFISYLCKDCKNFIGFNIDIDYDDEKQDLITLIIDREKANNYNCYICGGKALAERQVFLKIEKDYKKLKNV